MRKEWLLTHPDKR